MSQPKTGDQCRGNAAPTQKYSGFHESSAHARSAAAIRVAMSFSVWAVLMIQCSPFEGVI